MILPTDSTTTSHPDAHDLEGSCADSPRVGVEAPILVIDSSLAGLALVRAIRSRLPDERVVFFGDLARAPYSHRSPANVTRFIDQICRHVDRIGPKHVLIACDVAGSTAIQTLRDQLAPAGVGVTNTIEPAARAVAERAGATRRPTIGVFAGHWTIEHRTLENAISRRRNKCNLFFRSTPTLDAMVNEGRSVEDPLLRLAATQYLDQLVRRGCETILLASTPLATIRRLMQQIVGDDAQIVDATQATAEDIARRLGRRRQLNLAEPIPADECPIAWYLSDDSPEIFDRAERLAGIGLPPPTLVTLDDLEPLRIGPALELRQTG